MTERYLTTAEAAAHFDVSMQTINNWVRRGLFPNVMYGPRTGRGQIQLIPESDLAGVTPPHAGRPVDPDPSEAAQAKRRSRARRSR